MARRCFIGFDRRDKEKKKPIQERKALEDWKELLEKRFPQPVSGGRPFVLKIANVVKDKETPEGLDLIGKGAILEHLAKWCERMCTEHSIDPGSEAMQALLQQAHWHEENKEDHVRTRDAVKKAANDVIDAQVATHAMVQDISRFLGVGMDGMDENHRKTHAKRDAIGGGKVSS